MTRPVLVDEAQEMPSAVLAELRLLSSARLDSHILLTVFLAGDGLHIVRRRLDGICEAAGLALADLDILVITAPTLRLDIEADRRNLAETVARHRPRLLILDPFVRLHRIDENASGEVAPLLAYLRELQRRHGMAVLLTRPRIVWSMSRWSASEHGRSE